MRRENITWQQRIVAIKAVGMTLADIASATGSKISTIGDLATGRKQQPLGDLALRLDGLYRQRETIKRVKGEAV